MLSLDDAKVREVEDLADSAVDNTVTATITQADGITSRYFEMSVIMPLEQDPKKVLRHLHTGFPRVEFSLLVLHSVGHEGAQQGEIASDNHARLEDSNRMRYGTVHGKLYKGATGDIYGDIEGNMYGDVLEDVYGSVRGRLYKPELDEVFTHSPPLTGQLRLTERLSV